MVGGAAPGWYPDPAGSGSVRFWDGTQWTGQIAAAAPAPGPYARPPAGPSGPPPAWQPPPYGPPAAQDTRWIVIGISALVAIALIVGAGLVVVGASSKREPVASRPLVSAPPDAAPYDPGLDENGRPRIVPYDARAPETRAATGALPAALYAVPSGPDVVTPDNARQVTETIWTLRQQAIALEDANQLSTFENDSALATDANRGCGCGQVVRYGAATNISVGVGHFTDFPAWFYAQLRTTVNDSPWDSLLVFTRTTRDDPWRLSFSGGGNAPQGHDALYPIAVESDGFTRPAPANILKRADQLVAALPAYWQAAKDGTKRPADPSWLPGTLTNKWAQHLALNQQGKVHRNNGLVGYYRYAVAHEPGPYVVQFADGVYYACASIIGQTTFVAPKGGRIAQPADRTNWGRQVVPGSYRAIMTVDEYTPCFGFDSVESQVSVAGVSPPDEVTTVAVP